jgi:hypothetical protein
MAQDTGKVNMPVYISGTATYHHCEYVPLPKAIIRHGYQE